MNKFFQTFDRYLEMFLHWFCIAAMVMLSVVLSAVVFVRFVPIAKLSWTDEAVEWAFAWLVFLGAAALWRKGEHFCVDIVTCRLERHPLGKFQKLFIEACCAFFFIMFTYYGYLLTVKANDRSPILMWPRPIWYAAMPIAGLIMSAYSLRSIILILKTIFNPRLPFPVERREALANEVKETP